jgi:hypothetical protein
MVPEVNSLMLFKFGQYKWIKKIKEGEISFACPGRYIDIAKRTGNSEQGDIDEGIFARLKKDDPRIQEAADLVKKDLEVIEDGDYVKLRRKSSYFIPTFCFYSYRGKDLLDNDIRQAGKQIISHYFDERMYSGFSPDEVRNVINSDLSPASLFIHPAPFRYILAGALYIKGIQFELRHIDYELFKNDEFYIEPTDKREELFYKFPKYAYQKEARVCLINNPLPSYYERFNLSLGELPDDCATFIPKKFYFQVEADIVEKST